MNRNKRATKVKTRAKTTTTRSPVANASRATVSTLSIAQAPAISRSTTHRKVSIANTTSSVVVTSQRSASTVQRRKVVASPSSSVPTPIAASIPSRIPSRLSPSFTAPQASPITASNRTIMTQSFKQPSFPQMQKPLTMMHMAKNVPMMVSQNNMFAPTTIAKRFGGGLGYSHYTDAHEIEKRILDILRTLPAVNKDKIGPKAHFQKDLGLDSLSQVELIIMMEHEFEVEINDQDAAHIETVEEAVTYFAHTPYAV